jgi:hypothetical protein
MKVGLRFTVTDEHIALLRAAVVRWEDCEYGAPSIDCKRPYGNSYVERDIAAILGWPHDRAAGLTDIQESRARELHEQTETVLQIILTTGAMQAGDYVRSETYTKDWRAA